MERQTHVVKDDPELSVPPPYQAAAAGVSELMDTKESIPMTPWSAGDPHGSLLGKRKAIEPLEEDFNGAGSSDEYSEAHDSKRGRSGLRSRKKRNYLEDDYVPDEFAEGRTLPVPFTI